ncbi:MAG: LamG domain-containing protein [Bacteroidota bacterium]|nr:LamG domain-containing protein [Bacteroidota bacterium]
MWLLGYNNRIRLALDKSKVDSALSNFPASLSLSTSSGIGDEDLSRYFIELGDNSKKCALTTWDGVQCPIEIERFDHGNKKACFWSKIPKISPSVDTDLFFYYNPLSPDNVGYVGDIESNVGESVWDSNFKLVLHMLDATTSTVKDSTSNDNDGAKKGANEPIEATGKVCKGQSFDGNDYIDVTSNAGLEGTSGLTVSVLVKQNNKLSPDQFIISKWTGSDGYLLYFDPTNDYFVFGVRDPSQYPVSTTSPVVGTWYQVTGTFSSSTARIYVNGIQEDAHTSAGLESSSQKIGIGYYSSGISNYINGFIDEVRISDIERSAAWLKADFHSCFDSLIKYKQFETFNPNRRNNVIREIGGLSYGCRR